MRMDLALVRWMKDCEAATLTRFMRAFTHLGDAVTWTGLALLTGLVEGSWTGIGLSLGYAALAGSLVSKGLKHMFKRNRPHQHIIALAPLVRIPDPWSFPSGHTSAAFAVFGFLSACNSPFCALSGVCAALIGISRVYLRAHFPTDVIVGGIIGFGTGWLVYENLLAISA